MPRAGHAVEVAAILTLPWALTFTAAAQNAPLKIDFSRDVQPIFRQYCYGCHGPAQQISGLRLDRRSSVFRMRRVSPGSTENSFLYSRVSKRGFGQMPPGGSLPPEQVRTLRAWIEQGAEWPDSLANEIDLPPADAAAVSLVDSIVAGKGQAFLKAAARNPKTLNARGPNGASPFLYAVRYGDAIMLRKLLAMGANPNLRDDAKATALIWAAGDFDKTRVLLEHGADVNAISDDRRTALMIAAGRPGGEATLKLLLDRGANPNPTTNPSGDSSPLALAAGAGSAASMRQLLEHGADLKLSGGLALSLALASDCKECLDLLMPRDLGPLAFNFGLVNSVGSVDATVVRSLLDRGADVNFADIFGRTPLMHAVLSDRAPLDVVRLLTERGANINAISKHEDSVDSGMSVLDIALMNGETPIARFLRQAGAKSARATAAVMPTPQAAPNGRSAVERALPVLQRGDQGFTAKAGCISCHNNNLVALVVSEARKLGVPVDERIAAQQLKANADYLRQIRPSLIQGFFPAQAGVEALGNIFGPSVVGYMLIALEAEGYARDLNTDAAVQYLRHQQRTDGHWAYPAADSRAPLCDDAIAQTALSMRSLQLYGPKEKDYERGIRLASAWLAEAVPATTYNSIWKLMGLAWAGADSTAKRRALTAVTALQREDGGWSDLSTTESSAFETGFALTALHMAGMPVTDAAYKRGVRFLLQSQLSDGSWFVRSRALGSQPYFETGFPHGYHQSISAAGTGWAALALAYATPHGK